MRPDIGLQLMVSNGPTNLIAGYGCGVWELMSYRGLHVARSPLLQHKADATASWVAAAGTAAAAAHVSALPSPFASVAMPARQPTTESTVSPSASSVRFARMRTLSAPEHRTEHRTREVKPQTSPTKSGVGGSPGEARLLSAQAAWAALGGSTSPSRHSAVNSPREAFQRWALSLSAVSFVLTHLSLIGRKRMFHRAHRDIQNVSQN